MVHRAETQHSPGPPPSLASQGVLPPGLDSPPWVQPLLLSARGQASFALQPRWLTAAWLPRTARLPCCSPSQRQLGLVGASHRSPGQSGLCLEGGTAGQTLEVDFPHPLPLTQNLGTSVCWKKLFSAHYTLSDPSSSTHPHVTHYPPPPPRRLRLLWAEEQPPGQGSWLSSQPSLRRAPGI